mmetsp:Transcript_70804/g.118395  ORF Transcript_70804/g.118395 Transcript_70804/m.118395 type:complete len:262 (-) Transcript_70804:2468-3253(-)
MLGRQLRQSRHLHAMPCRTVGRPRLHQLLPWHAAAGAGLPRRLLQHCRVGRTPRFLQFMDRGLCLQPNRLRHFQVHWEVLPAEVPRRDPDRYDRRGALRGPRAVPADLVHPERRGLRPAGGVRVPARLRRRCLPVRVPRRHGGRSDQPLLRPWPVRRQLVRHQREPAVPRWRRLHVQSRLGWPGLRRRMPQRNSGQLERCHLRRTRDVHHRRVECRVLRVRQHPMGRGAGLQGLRERLLRGPVPVQLHGCHRGGVRRPRLL